MAVGRYFQGLSSYDLLGNLLPGAVGLATLLGFTSPPPLPQSIGGLTLYAAGAFILGSVIQGYASQAVGKPRSFIRTISTTEQLPSLQETTTPDDPDLDSVDIEQIERREPDDDPLPADAPAYLQISSYSRGVSLVHAFVGPLLWWYFDKRGEVLADSILSNRIWMNLTDTHELQSDTTEFGVLYHLMASELDDPRAPSRALRMQAIRNFNRGMWITAWGLLVLVSITIVLDSCFDPNDIILALPGIGTVVYTQPAYFDYWTPIGSLLGVAVVATLVFWVLYRSSEEDYVEYLFTDYAVSIAERGTELSISDTSGPLSFEVAHPEEIEQARDEAPAEDE